LARTAAVFFDVDFTLIHPGPRFQGSGYQASCARRNVQVDVARFDTAVAGAAAILDEAAETYDPALYYSYTQRIIELMGGTGPDVPLVARDIYDDWAEHHHFSLYDDVPGALRALQDNGVRIGLISNSHRCLTSFQSHFDLDGLIAVAISSSEHGVMKPHPQIFRAGLELMGVAAHEAVMVGDSLAHDIAGARGVGMRGIWLARGERRHAPDPDVSVITSLDELPGILA
jgi:putative hydrolase of the HAD superfamily